MLKRNHTVNNGNNNALIRIRLRAEYEFKEEKIQTHTQRKGLKANENVPNTTTKGFLNCCQ